MHACWLCVCVIINNDYYVHRCSYNLEWIYPATNFHKKRFLFTDSEKDNFMAINIDNGGYNGIDIEQKPEYYHLAVDGYTFSIIKEHYKQLFKRVCYIHHCLKLLLSSLLSVISLWYSVCSNVP